MVCLRELGLKRLHLDIMDAEFVPRFGLYPEISHLIDKEFDLIFDAHFMVNDVVKSLREWRKYHNPSKISFHYDRNETCMREIIEEIEKENSLALIALDLTLDDQVVLNMLNKYKPDGVMLLGITPGVLDQVHQPEMVLHRLNFSKNEIKFPLQSIQVDGGVNFKTIRNLIEHGATELICGSSSIYKNIDFRALIQNKMP